MNNLNIFKCLIVLSLICAFSCTSNSGDKFVGYWGTDSGSDTFHIKPQGNQFVLEYKGKERLFEYNKSTGMLISNDDETERDIALSEEKKAVFYENGVKVLELKQLK